MAGRHKRKGNGGNGRPDDVALGPSTDIGVAMAGDDAMDKMSGESGAETDGTVTAGAA